jgi:hypothetical protein
MNDPAPSLADQMSSRLVGGFLIVDKDAGAVLVFGDTVEEDEGDLFFEERLEMGEGIRIVCEGDEQAVYPAVKEGGGIGLFFFERFGGLTDDKVVSFIVGDAFHPRDHGRHKVAIDAGNNYTYSIGAAGAEVTGEVVAAIAQFLRQIGDPLLCLFADDGVVLQGSAYRGDGKVQLACKIVYRNFFLITHSNRLRPFDRSKNRVFLEKKCNRLHFFENLLTFDLRNCSLHTCHTKKHD